MGSTEQTPKSMIQIQLFEEVRKATSKMKQEQKMVQTNQLEILGMKMVQREKQLRGLTDESTTR